MMSHSIGQLTKREMIIVFLPVRSGLLLSHKSAGEHRPKETIIQMSSIFKLMDTMCNEDFDRKWEDDAKEERLDRSDVFGVQRNNQH